MAVIYNVLELSTAVKPWLLRWMLARRRRRARVYLDPDMRLYAPLTEVFQAVRDARARAQPAQHRGDAARRPQAERAGHPDRGRLQPRLHRHRRRARSPTSCSTGGASGSSATASSTPSAASSSTSAGSTSCPGWRSTFHVLRDPGFNVAYWNLATRPVSERDGTLVRQGRRPAAAVPLQRLRRPTGRTCSPSTRTASGWPTTPTSRGLCELYAAELLANGVHDVAGWPYTYDTSASGIPLDRLNRRVYRELMIDGFDDSLFEPDGEAAFADARRPRRRSVGGEFGVNALPGDAVRRCAATCRPRFPDLADPVDGRGFVEWAHTIGRHEVPIPEALLPPDGSGPADGDGRRPRPTRPPPVKAAPAPASGVNVVGYLNSELGVGEVARQVIDALDAVSVPSLPVGLIAHAQPPGPRVRARRRVAATTTRSTSLCVNADMLPELAGQVGPQFFERPPHDRAVVVGGVGVPGPLARRASTTSTSCGRARSSWPRRSPPVSPVPVVHMPMPVTLPPVVTARRASRSGCPTASCSCSSTTSTRCSRARTRSGCSTRSCARSRTRARARSWCSRASTPSGTPTSTTGCGSPPQGTPHVHLLDYYVSAEEKNGLIAAADCYASLHRSEGFGITMAEAMLLGKPVVATAYSGNLDFMRPENAYLVDYELAADRARQRPVSGRGAVGGAGPRPRRAAAARGVRRPARRRARRGETARRRHPPRRTRPRRRAGRWSSACGAIRGMLPADDFDPTGLARARGGGRAGARAERREPPAAGRRSRLRRVPRAAVLRRDEAAHELRAAGRPRTSPTRSCTSATRSTCSRAAWTRSSTRERESTALLPARAAHASTAASTS